jgi:BASS family bile acid:Na+ symporter
VRGLGVLEASARHGSALLGAGIFGGILVPPLARALNPTVSFDVIALMTLVLLRVDFAAALAYLHRPLRVAGVVAFQLLLSPVLAWAAVSRLPLDPAIAAGVVLFATGCPAISSPAFARLTGLDPELTLLATLAATLLLPLTAPPLATALAGVDLALGFGGLMVRLAIVVGAPMVLALLLRRAIGPRRLVSLAAAVDGAVVWLLVLFGIGVMAGLTARLLHDPGWVIEAALAAFAAALGLNLATTLAFAAIGWRQAASAGLMSGNRNMALYLAVLPASADPRLALFFALCQFPLYLSPFLLRPAYRRLLS